MIIEYKGYVGIVISMHQLEGTLYYFTIKKDLEEDVEINFKCDIHDIKLKNCIGNDFLFEK